MRVIMANAKYPYKKFVPLVPGQTPEIPKAFQSDLEKPLSQPVDDYNGHRGRWDSDKRVSNIPAKILTPMEIRSRIMALMNEKNFDPVKTLIGIAANSGTEEKVRIDICKELIQYIAPKLKSTDIQMVADLNVTVNVVKFADNKQTLAPNREAVPVRHERTPIDITPEQTGT